jgi:hypothetical protein
VAWLLLICAIPFLTDAAIDLIAFFVLGAADFFLAVTWMMITFLTRVPLRYRVHDWSWLSFLVAGYLGLVLATTNWGFAVRVALSEAALREYIAQVPAGAEEWHEARKIGLFNVRKTSEQAGAVFLHTSTSFLNEHGVAYVPGGQIPPGRIRLRGHLYGPWYSFEWKF